MPKLKQKDALMGNYIPKKEEYEANRWCTMNKVFIYPVPAGTSSWYIEIDIKGSKKRSPSPYPKVEIWKKIFELSKFYYNKYEKKV